MKGMDVREWMGGNGAKERKAAMGVKKPCPCPSEHKTLSGQELSHTHTHDGLHFPPCLICFKMKENSNIFDASITPKKNSGHFFLFLPFFYSLLFASSPLIPHLPPPSHWFYQPFASFAREITLRSLGEMLAAADLKGLAILCRAFQLPELRRGQGGVTMATENFKNMVYSAGILQINWQTVAAS